MSVVTIDDRTVPVSGVLKPGQREDSLLPDHGELVLQSLQHTLIDAVIEVIVNLGLVPQTTQQFVDQLTATETHCLVPRSVVLGQHAKQAAKVRRY